MGFFEDNRRVIGIFNTIFIAIIIVFNLLLLSELPLISIIESVAYIIALLFGLIYAIKGYQKKSAKLYKTFMIMFYISSLISLVVPILLGLNDEAANFTSILITTVFNLVIVICSCILAIGKDLEKKFSMTLSYLILVSSLIKIVIAFVVASPIQTICICVSNIYLACMLCAFVAIKYMDKETRGTI